MSCAFNLRAECLQLHTATEKALTGRLEAYLLLCSIKPGSEQSIRISAHAEATERVAYLRAVVSTSKEQRADIHGSWETG